MGYYQLRAYYYDSDGQYISYQTAVSRAEGTLTPAWEEGGGQVTTPATAATLRLYLYNYNSSGWVALDNVRLSKPSGSTIKRSSYGIAGQVIATRVTGDPVSGNNGLFFIYSDHLGSASLLVDSSNNPVVGSRTWYLPFGGYRPGSTPTQTITDRDFTGQRENMELGLLYYNARYYVPYINRFVSADSIVPDPANPQSFNRYSYVENRPLNFSDPTGHQPAACSYEGECGIPIGLIDFDGVKSNGQILVDIFTFSVIDPVMSVVELGEASFSGQMREDFQTEPLQASARYGLPTLGLVASLMGFGKAVDEGLGFVDDFVKAIDDDAARIVTPSRVQPPTGMLDPDQIQYTDKVIGQMGHGNYVTAPDFHGFPREVDYWLPDQGVANPLVDGDGVFRTQVTIQGGYKGRTGVFEYIFEPDGVTVNHRYFRPNP